MRAIINRRRYDTSTAVEIVSYYNGLGDSDFRHEQSKLYKTKNGGYFLAGQGGPMSRWSAACGGNCTRGGEGIVEFSRDEAYEWCERLEFFKTIENEFSDLVKEG